MGGGIWDANGAVLGIGNAWWAKHEKTWEYPLYKWSVLMGKSWNSMGNFPWDLESLRFPKNIQASCLFISVSWDVIQEAIAMREMTHGVASRVWRHISGCLMGYESGIPAMQMEPGPLWLRRLETNFVAESQGAPYLTEYTWQLAVRS